MPNSELKKKRKKIAQLIEDEVFTINTELDNLINVLSGFNYKELKKLNLSNLKEIRVNLGKINSLISKTQSRFDNIGETRSSAIVQVEGISVVANFSSKEMLLLES